MAKIFVDRHAIDANRKQTSKNNHIPPIVVVENDGEAKRYDHDVYIERAKLIYEPSKPFRFEGQDIVLWIEELE